MASDHYLWEHPTLPPRVARTADADFACKEPLWVRCYPVDVHVGQAPARPDLVNRLSYLAHERDDLAISDAVSYLGTGWSQVRGRTERQLVMQILALMAGAPAAKPLRPEACTNRDDPRGCFRVRCQLGNACIEEAVLWGPWRVGEFVSSARRPEHVLMLAIGAQQIAEYGAHADFVRWVSP